jgi:hypothetical protein
MISLRPASTEWTDAGGAEMQRAVAQRRTTTVAPTRARE